MTLSRRILVTGAGGLIGGCAANALHQKGYEVVGLYRQLDPGEASVPWKVVRCDLLREDAPQKLDEVDCDFVVHCAAVLPSQFFGAEAERAAQANLVMDEQIANLCLVRSRRLVYISSTSVYGVCKGSPIAEEEDVAPIGPYGSAKAESEGRILSQLRGRAVILRVSSPYGAGQRRMTVLRSFVERALANLDLMYQGTGNRQQDFVSAFDVGKAIRCAISNANASGIFNVARGCPISMRDLAELVVRTVPGTLSHVVASQQPDPQENYEALFDTRKALKILRWWPIVRLEDGIRSYAEHLRATNPHSQSQ